MKTSANLRAGIVKHKAFCQHCECTTCLEEFLDWLG